jgi:hypothetical protein
LMRDKRGRLAENRRTLDRSVLPELFWKSFEDVWVLENACRSVRFCAASSNSPICPRFDAREERES